MLRDASKCRTPKSEATKKCKVAAEKRRKEKITSLISELTSVLPIHLLPTNNQIDVLETSIKYIGTLRSDMDCLLAGSVKDVTKKEIDALKAIQLKLERKLTAYEKITKHAGIPSSFNPLKFVSELNKTSPIPCSAEDTLTEMPPKTFIILPPPTKEFKEFGSQTDPSVPDSLSSLKGSLSSLHGSSLNTPINVTNNYLILPSKTPSKLNEVYKKKRLLPKALALDKSVECCLIDASIPKPITHYQSTQTNVISVNSISVQCDCLVSRSIDTQTDLTLNQSISNQWSVSTVTQTSTPPFITATSTASTRFTVDYLHNKRSNMATSSHSALKQLSTLAANCQVSSSTPSKANTRNFSSSSKQRPMETNDQVPKQTFKRKSTAQPSSGNHYAPQFAYGKSNVVEQEQYPAINLNDSLFDVNSSDNYWPSYNSFMSSQQNPYEWQQAFNTPTCTAYYGPQSFSVTALTGNLDKTGTNPGTDLCANAGHAINNSPITFSKIDSSKSQSSLSLGAKPNPTPGRRFEIAHIFPEESSNNMDSSFASFSGGGPIWGAPSAPTPPVSNSDSTYAGCAYYQSGQYANTGTHPHYYTSTLPYDPWPTRQDHSALPSIFQLGTSNIRSS